MSQQGPKDMRGVMTSTHERKVRQHEPDYVGVVNIGGQYFRIAGWYEPPAEGRRVARIRLAIEDEESYKQRRQGVNGLKPQPKTEPAVRRQEDAFANEIPF